MSKLLFYPGLGLTLMTAGFLTGTLYGPALLQTVSDKAGHQLPTAAVYSAPDLPASAALTSSRTTNTRESNLQMPWLALAGVTQTGTGASSALIEDCTGSQRAYRVGQLVADGYLLSDIQTSSARLDKAGQTLTLQLGHRSLLAATTAQKYPIANATAAPEAPTFGEPGGPIGVLSANAAATNLTGVMTAEEADKLFEPGPDIDAMFDLPPELPPEQETEAP